MKLQRNPKSKIAYDRWDQMFPIDHAKEGSPCETFHSIVPVKSPTWSGISLTGGGIIWGKAHPAVQSFHVFLSSGAPGSHWPAIAIAERRQPVSAIINGRVTEFDTEKAKFDALVEAWEDHQTGRSVTDFNHVAYTQIIGMGTTAIAWLLDKLTEGDGDWIYALKCITGQEAETPDMYGDADRVIAAWRAWGDRYAAKPKR
jgi:hypothetical protein